MGGDDLCPVTEVGEPLLEGVVHFGPKRKVVDKYHPVGMTRRIKSMGTLKCCTIFWLDTLNVMVQGISRCQGCKRVIKVIPIYITW